MKCNLNSVINSKRSILIVISIFFLQLMIFIVFCRKTQELARLNAELTRTEGLLSQTMQLNTEKDSNGLRIFKNSSEALSFVKGLNITKDISFRQISANTVSDYNTITILGEADTKEIVNFLAGIRKTKAVIRVGSFELKSTDSGKISYNIMLEYPVGKRAANDNAKQ